MISRISCIVEACDLFVHAHIAGALENCGHALALLSYALLQSSDLLAHCKAHLCPLAIPSPFAIAGFKHDRIGSFVSSQPQSSDASEQL